MSYRFEQTIRGHVYVYEIESFWDPEKNNPAREGSILGKKIPGRVKSVPRCPASHRALRVTSAISTW